MAPICQQCIFEKGINSLLRQAEGGKMVCELNPAHKYELGKDAYIRPAH